MSIAREIARNGFAFVSEYLPSLSTEAVAARFGDTLVLPSFPAVQKLIPKPLAGATPNSYSGNYGLSQFPLHTDLAHWARPPRYFLLRCISGSADVATQLLDGKSISRALGAEQLLRALVRPRRPLNGQRALLRLLDTPDDRTTLMRWDYLYIRPASEASKAVYDDVGQFLQNAARRDVSLARPGDTLLIDNWRMLHGRSSVSQAASNRLIERTYLGELH